VQNSFYRQTLPVTTFDYSMSRNASSNSSTANIGFEAKLWLAADKLRNNMDAAEYKHVVLGLIFLKYISDSFEEHRSKLVAGEGDYAGANPEDQDEYRAENVFWVPKESRWSHLQANAKQPAIGKIVDDAMVALERDNPRLKGVLPKDYARPGLDMDFKIPSISCVRPKFYHSALDSEHSLDNFYSSKPAGPLSQDMLSHGGSFFTRRLRA